MASGPIKMLFPLVPKWIEMQLFKRSKIRFYFGDGTVINLSLI